VVFTFKTFPLTTTIDTQQWSELFLVLFLKFNEFRIEMKTPYTNKEIKRENMVIEKPNMKNY